MVSKEPDVNDAAGAIQMSVSLQRCAASDTNRSGVPHPGFGYRRMTGILVREGHRVNHKRIQRLCRDEGIRVLKKAKKRSRVGTSVTDGTKHVANRSIVGEGIHCSFDLR